MQEWDGMGWQGMENLNRNRMGRGGSNGLEMGILYCVAQLAGPHLLFKTILKHTHEIS